MTTDQALQLKPGDEVITIYGDCLEVISVSYDHIILNGLNRIYDCCPSFRAFEIECKVDKKKHCK